jgi:hypothetical protein
LVSNADKIGVVVAAGFRLVLPKSEEYLLQLVNNIPRVRGRTSAFCMLKFLIVISFIVKLNMMY